MKRGFLNKEIMLKSEPESEPSPESENTCLDDEYEFLNYYEPCSKIHYINRRKIELEKIWREKFSKKPIDEDELFDVISGDILDDPVRFKSNGKLTKGVLNMKTAKKLKKCPFTQSTEFELVEATDMKEFIELFKMFHHDRYIEILEKIKSEKIKNQQIIEDKARDFVMHVLELFMNPKNIYMKRPISFYISNENAEHGIDKLTLEEIKKIVDKEDYELSPNKYLEYKIVYRENIPDIIEFGTICRCFNCVSTNVFGFLLTTAYESGNTDADLLD